MGESFGHLGFWEEDILIEYMNGGHAVNYLDFKHSEIEDRRLRIWAPYLRD